MRSRRTPTPFAPPQPLKPTVTPSEPSHQTCPRTHGYGCAIGYGAATIAFSRFVRTSIVWSNCFSSVSLLIAVLRNPTLVVQRTDLVEVSIAVSVITAG